MRALRSASALGATALMLCALTSAAAQQRSRQRAPIIRVYSTSGTDVINTSTYIEPQIDLSEDAYVFAVEMDLDGQIQVLHPDFPGLSVKIMARTQLRLPNFFVGFNQAGPYGRVYSNAAFQRYSPYGGYMDTRGTVLALASRAPFNLERIESGGDWNISAIRRLIEDRSPLEALSVLANYLGANGEPIGRDYLRVAGGATNYYAYNDYYSSYFSPCDFYNGYFYAPGLGFAQSLALNRINRARNQRAKIVGFNLCGVPIISYGPVIASRLPIPGVPRTTGDTTVFPKSRFRDHGVPRHPGEAGSNTAAEGIFPLTRRPGVGQMGDVTITAPVSRRGEPRIIEGYRTQPSPLSMPQGRIPVDRSVPQPAAATGAQPLREYRPEPRVQSPPPSRVPDRAPAPAPAPAPVVHERPSPPPPPPPPPPRAESPSKPPPNRK
jgi:hypothetical protein